MTLQAFFGFTLSPGRQRQGLGQKPERFLLSRPVPGAPIPTFPQRGKE